jgi:hypothetical protein
MIFLEKILMASYKNLIRSKCKCGCRVGWNEKKMSKCLSLTPKPAISVYFAMEEDVNYKFLKHYEVYCKFLNIGEFKFKNTSNFKG